MYLAVVIRTKELSIKLVNKHGLKRSRTAVQRPESEFSRQLIVRQLHLAFEFLIRYEGLIGKMTNRNPQGNSHAI